MANVKRIRIEDGGDGSTFLSITLEDGTVKRSNPDIPYEGYVVLEFEGDQMNEEVYVEGE